MLLLALLITVISAVRIQNTTELNNSLKTIVDTDNLQFIPCILDLSEKYFRSNQKVKGSLIIINFTPNDSEFQKIILKRFNENEEHEYSLMAKYALLPHKNASHVTDKAKNYFFIIEKSNEISAILIQLRGLPTWNPFAKILVLLIRSMPLSLTTLHEEFIEIFSILLRKTMLNANVMYVTLKNSIEVVTWFPYENDNCAKQIDHVEIIDQCEVIYNKDFSSSTVKYRTFMDKIDKIPSDLHNCPLMIATSDWPPFTIYNDKEKRFVRGVEIEMLKTIAGRMGLLPIFEKTNATRSQMENSVMFYEPILSS